MVDQAVDNQPGTEAPAPIPAVTEAHISRDIRSAAGDALKQLRATDSDKPVTPPTAEPKATEEPITELPRLTQPEPKKEAVGFDPTKLSPELQDSYKSMQADYTRKTQELSEQRKSLLDEREKFLEKAMLALQPKEPKTEATPATNPLEQIKQLRDEGRHDEADQLLFEASERAALERVSGLEKAAKLSEMKATFRDVLTDTTMNNKVVGFYKDDVAKIFDQQTPVMEEIRRELLKSPERMKMLVPPVLDMIARAVHGQRLEREMDARIKAGIEAGIAAEKAKAGKVPAKLVESSQGARETPRRQFNSEREAAKAALAELTGAES
jgi:hypothetical protein